MALSRIFSFDDPAACEAIFPSADVELFPTTSGSFHADVSQIGIGGIWLHRIHISLPEINTVAVKPGRMLIGFLTEQNSSSLVDCGRDIRPGDIVINRSNVVHQRSDANFHYATVSLAVDRLAAAAGAMIGRELSEISLKCVIRPSSGPMLRLLTLHKVIAKVAHDTPDVLDFPEVSRALENELTHILVRCFSEGASIEPTSRGRRHGTILARFVKFLEANPDRPLYLTEICAAIGAAERTLRASCEDHLGMGPIRYLTLRRMHLVRRALQRSDGSKVTVTRILTDHGFWELGRFAVAYRTLFGESPSDTLRHSTYQAGLAPSRFSSLAVVH